jgi:hypothetical protein
MICRLATIAVLGVATSVYALPPPAATRAQALDALSADTRTLVVRWLNRDCDAAEQRRLEAQLGALGPRLEPVFLEAYRLGPPPAQTERDRTAFARHYDERQAELRRTGTKLFGAKETERLLAVTKDEYVRQELDRAAIGYKTAAVAGLGLVGTEHSLQELSRIAADTADPANIAAQGALRDVRARLAKRPRL